VIINNLQNVLNDDVMCNIGFVIPLPCSITKCGGNGF